VRGLKEHKPCYLSSNLFNHHQLVILANKDDTMPAKKAEIVGAEKLLARGSRILGIAALAHARGDGRWHVLSAETIAATEEILSYLEQKPDSVVLEAVIGAALASEPATQPPSWSKPLFHNQPMIERIGALIDASRLRAALGARHASPTDRLKGLAALAIGLCRSLDSLGALAQNLPVEDRAELMPMGYLAHTLVEPGEPSTMRSDIRRIMREVSHG
jgi:hypothetical protein